MSNNDSSIGSGVAAASSIASQNNTPSAARPEVIAQRKTCDAEGTGLSHYVLMDKQAGK